MGYGSTTIKLDFPELSENPADDPIWVIIRNPKLLPEDELTSFAEGNPDIETDEDGEPTGEIDPETMAKMASTGNRLMAHLVVASRVYDATVFREYDDNGDEIIEPATDPVRLPSKLTAEDCKKLPGAIKLRMAEELRKANPQRTPG